MTRENLERKQVSGRLQPALRLVFMSAASRPLSSSELDALERVSRRRNEAAGIAGFLLAQGSHYLGVLEGPEPLLLDRMEIIATDPRHCRLRILREQNLAARRFVGWRLFRLPPLLSQAEEPADFFHDFARRLA